MESYHKEKAELMKEYKFKIFDLSICHYYSAGEIPSKQFANATKAFASGIDKDKIIGFYDTTIAGSGKNGYIFTDDKMYYLELLSKPKKIWYEDIKSMEILHTEKKDCDRTLKLIMTDDTIIYMTSVILRKTPLKEFLEKIKEFDVKADRVNYTGKLQKNDNLGAEAAGRGIGHYKMVNNQFDEEKFHARQGHGFAAEEANTLYDKLTGHDAKVVGNDNVKNGADRLVDGVYIQSKYCATGSRCIKDCFEDGGKGKFRYIVDGKPMKIEVPSDKYEAAVEAMQEKIRRGQVNGVTDPAEAKNIVKKGHFTYEQAKNIAKAGKIESLTYDAVNGTIIAGEAFVMTSMLTLATSLWNGEDFDVAIKVAAYSGIKVGGTAFVISVLASQLLKAGLNSALVGGSEAIISVMGPKASAVLVNAFRNGSNIYGAAAMKSAAKLLRTNVITAGVTFAITSSVDIADIFRGRISGKQLFKNMVGTGASIGGGTAGWVVGAAIGSVVPVVGNIIGGIAGAIAGGIAANKVSDAAVGMFVEDDAEEMVKIIQDVFTDLASDYLLNNKEAEKIVDSLKEKLDGKILKNMFASSLRREFARELLTPLIEKEIEKREFITIPTDDEMTNALKCILEEIDNEESAD